MTTKVPAELSSTPSIVDNGNATAITIDSSERVGILQGSPTSNLHIGATGNDAKRELRLDGTNGSGQTYGCIIQADGENGRFVFKVGQSGNTPAQQFMVHPDGGICFGTDTAAANALDDYEEGTFTPTIVSGATSVSYSTQAGHYTKIGNTMTVHMRVQPSSLTKQGSLLVFDGLPESCKLSTYGAGIVSYTSSFANENVNLYINPGSTQISIYKRIGTSFVGNDLVSTAFDFRIMAVYLT